jgi:hypothetical protein
MVVGSMPSAPVKAIAEIIRNMPSVYQVPLGKAGTYTSAMQSAIIYALIGLVAGVLSGLFGIGGGILIIPALVVLSGFTQQRAQGTSLVALLAPVGILAFVEYYRKNEADFKAGLIIALALFVGAYFGARVAVHLPEVVMRKSFAGFLGIVAVWMFFRS